MDRLTIFQQVKKQSPDQTTSKVRASSYSIFISPFKNEKTYEIFMLALDRFSIFVKLLIV